MSDFTELFAKSKALIDNARSSMGVVVNAVTVYTSYLLGKYMIEEEQQGSERAQYDAKVLDSLSDYLTNEYGRGERGFSLAKRCYGMGLIRTKLDTTTRASIALSVIAMNINHLAECFLRCIMISIFSRYRWQKKLPEISILACQFQWAAC